MEHVFFACVGVCVLICFAHEALAKGYFPENDNLQVFPWYF